MTVRALVVVVCAAAVVAGGCAKVGDVIGTTFGESASTPPPNATLAHVQAPPEGTKWIVRASSYNETASRAETKTTTWTSMGEGSQQGRQVFRVSDGATVHVHDRATGAWLAVLDRSDRELISWQPNDGTFSSPLWVGKQWTARSTRHDRVQRRSLNDLVTVWTVAAFEDVQVPAGRFKAFRVDAWPDSRDSIRKRTYWYAPDLRLIVKETTEGFGEPYAIGVGRDRIRSTTELMEYIAAGPPAGTLTAQEKPLSPAERAKLLATTLAEDRDAAQRTRAAEALGEVDASLYAVAIPALGRAAGGDAAPGVRTAAARMLNRLMLKTPDAGVALGDAAKRSREAVMMLAEAVLHPDLRLRAIDLLGKAGAPASAGLGVLREMLNERDPAIRTAAATAIGSIGATPEDVAPLMHALRDAERPVQDAAAVALKDRSPDVIKLVTPDLIDSTPEIRRRATQVLGGLASVSPTDVVPLLRNALEDRDAGVRAMGARGLGRAGEAGAGALREALRHDDAGVRAVAAETIVTVSSRRAETATALVPLLDDPDAGVRSSAVRALGTLGADARGAAPALKRVSERDASTDVRALATRALDAIGAR